jgi:hypothetical protein
MSSFTKSEVTVMLIKTPPFPPNIQIELTNICNARCITCPVATMAREREIMDFGLFTRIIGELKRHNFHGWVFPFLNGESLLVPDFAAYMRLVRREIPQARIYLTTNASRLSDELGRRLLENDALDILCVSFDGGTRQAYETVRRGLSFDEVRQNVHAFIGNRNRMGQKKPEVTLSMVLTPENIHTKEALKREFADADSIDFSLMFNWAGQLKGGEKRSYFWGKGNFCPRMYNLLTVLVNGDIALCCFDYEGRQIVGSIQEATIEEVWRGQALASKRQLLAKRRFEELPLCHDCDWINHNLITQQLFKLNYLLDVPFPRLARLGVTLYKSALGLVRRR